MIHFQKARLRSSDPAVNGEDRRVFRGGRVWEAPIAAVDPTAAADLIVAADPTAAADRIVAADLIAEADLNEPVGRYEEEVQIAEEADRNAADVQIAVVVLTVVADLIVALVQIAVETPIVEEDQSAVVDRNAVAAQNGSVQSVAHNVAPTAARISPSAPPFQNVTASMEVQQVVQH
jgi:hypothetical protein